MSRIKRKKELFINNTWKKAIVAVIGGCALLYFGMKIISQKLPTSHGTEHENEIETDPLPTGQDTPEDIQDSVPDINETAPDRTENTEEAAPPYIGYEGPTDYELSELEKRFQETGGFTYQPNELGTGLPVGGTYLNRVLSVTFPGGSVLKIGADTPEDRYLYMNPVFEPSDEDALFSSGQNVYAFCFTTEYGGEFEFSGSSPAPYDRGKNADERFFAVSGRTYDTLVPAGFVDAGEYGVRWRDTNNFHGFDGTDCDIGIRVICPVDGRLMGTAVLQVVFDPLTCCYLPVALIDTDVVQTGEMSEAEKSALLDTAFEFFCDDSKGQSTGADPARQEMIKADAIVESVPSFYYPRLFDAEGYVISAGDYPGLYLYAVNFNYPGFGVVTIYATPEKQLNGLRGSVSPKEDLQVLGFDAFKPFSKDTLFVPEYMKAEFFAE